MTDVSSYHRQHIQLEQADFAMLEWLDPAMAARLFVAPGAEVALTMFALYGAIYLSTLYLQVLRGLSAFDAGLILLLTGVRVCGCLLGWWSHDG